MPKPQTTEKRSTANRVSLALVAVVLIGVGYFGFRWLRGLMMLGEVDSAIVRMRFLYQAETQFSKTYPTLGYTCTLSQLPRSDVIQQLAARNGIENGYAFEIVGCQAPDVERPNAIFSITARPFHSGQPAFCSDQSGILKADYGGSVESCLAKGVPL